MKYYKHKETGETWPQSRIDHEQPEMKLFVDLGEVDLDNDNISTFERKQGIADSKIYIEEMSDDTIIVVELCMKIVLSEDEEDFESHCEEYIREQKLDQYAIWESLGKGKSSELMEKFFRGLAATATNDKKIIKYQQVIDLLTMAEKRVKKIELLEEKVKKLEKISKVGKSNG